MTKERAAAPTTTVVDVAFNESFDVFYRREFSSLTALAAATAGDRSIAEDLAQEALTRVHKRWETVGRYEKPGAWARRVTINLALSARQRRTIELKAKLSLRRTERAVSLPASSGAHDSIWSAVAELPGQQRAAIALHYLEDRPVAEIAEILECSPSTAKVHLHRGRAALHERLAQTSGGQS